MEKLARQNRAPAGAIVPLALPTDKLSKLDINDPIWEDVGLDDSTDDHPGGSIPRWLSDEKVRKGIRGLLQCDRCLEEEQRLLQERADLEDWAVMEWKSLEVAKALAGTWRSIR